MTELRKPETLEGTIFEHEDRLRRVESIASSTYDIYVPWELANQLIDVTSATFVPVAHLSLLTVQHEVLSIAEVVVTGAGDEGEVRLREINSGAVTAVAAVGPGPAQHWVQFAWLHERHLGDTPVDVVLEARRTAGATPVGCYYPRRSLFTTTRRFPNAATDGNPSVT